MDDNIHKLCDRLSKNVDSFEVVKKQFNKTTVKVEKGNISDFKESIETQYSIRIIKNGKIGFTYATSLADSDKIVEKVVNLSKYSDYSELNDFYNNEFKEINLELIS